MGLRTRHVALALAVAVAAALTVGTGGFSSATVERGVEIAVVDDSEASLGVSMEPVGTAVPPIRHDSTADGHSMGDSRIAEKPNERGPDRQYRIAVTLTNRFGTELESVTVSAENTSSLGLAPGESATVTVTADCGTQEVTIEAAGDAVRVVLERTVTVPCSVGPPTDSPDSAGGSSNEREQTGRVSRTDADEGVEESDPDESR